jgi:hypothetical protein
MKLGNKIISYFLVVAAFFSLGATSGNLTAYYIIAGLLALALISILVKNPHWGIYLMALLFPFIYLEVIYGDLNVPYVDLMALMLFIAWAIRSIYFHVKGIKRLSLNDFPGWFFMGLYVLACSMSLFNVDHEYFYFCLKYLFRPIIFFYMMFVVLPFNILDSWKKFYNTLKVMFGVGIGLSFMGLWSLIFPPVQGLRRVLPVEIFGIFPVGANHNQIAEIFILLIPLALILYWQEKNIFWKNMYLSGVFFMAGINMLTLSRSGWISLGLEIALLVWFKYRHQIKKIFTPVALYYLAIILVPAVILMYLLVQAGITESATLNRLKLIEVSFVLFYQYPLFGAGIGIFTEIMAQVKWYLIEYGGVLDAHGFIFKNIAETGLFGTVTFCTLIFYYLYITFKAYKYNRQNQYSWIILGLLMAMIGIFSFQLFGTSYYLGKTWLAVGLGLAGLKLCKIKYLT